MNLAIAFTQALLDHRGKPAIFWGDEEITYAQLGTESQWLAEQLLRKHNIKAGDRVAIWLKNCPEFVSVLFGILRAGAVVVPINNFLKPDEVLYILQDSGARALVTESGVADAVGRLKEGLPGLSVIHIEAFKDAVASGTVPVLEPAPTAEDLAVIIYTSGTTGRPKGAMLSHGNLLHNVESCRQVLKVAGYDRFAVVLPMFHSFMLTVGILLPISVGGSLVLVKSLHPPRNIIQDIYQRQATILPAIPQLFRALANAQMPPNLPLRLCISGAAPLPVEVLKEFNAKFLIPLLEGYGLSEASPVVSMNPIEGPWKAGSIGRTVPGVEVSIQDESGQPLPTGEAGELCVRGGNVMLGYWNQPEETAKVMRGEWLLTGDIGYQDADGYIYITDRKKDMLLVNGINVYPREVEEIIYQFPGVKEAAVVSRLDSRKGETPVAFVAANENIQLEERALIQFLRGKLADYKVPRQITMLPQLPRNATGKILKTTLREMARSQPHTTAAEEARP